MALRSLGMEHDEIASRLDRLNADLARLEDKIVGVYEEVLRLRVDIDKSTSRLEKWQIVSSAWAPPMPD